jgi:hypothetical protein
LQAALRNHLAADPDREHAVTMHHALELAARMRISSTSRDTFRPPAVEPVHATNEEKCGDR